MARVDATVLVDAASDTGPVADASSDTGSLIDANSTDASIEGGAPPKAPLEVTLLDDVTLADGTHYQLLKLQHAPEPATYAQWYPPASGTRRPVVVVTKPYDGIDWSDADVDMRWATLGSGFHPDIESPGAGSNPGGISYTLSSAETTDDGSLFRLHDMGALLLYGRFYAGGDVQNDIDDMTTGLDFLATTELADRTRIGIWGGSWGGFEALYGAAYAHDDVRPSVGAALAPLSDFEREVSFVTGDLPTLYSLPMNRDAAATFFAPYLRRVGSTRDARGGYQGLRAVDLVQRIHVPFLLIHDDWDTLVSFDQSTALVSLAPEVFQPLWLQHAAPPLLWDVAVNTHGPLLQQFSNATITFLTTFVLTRLADTDQPITTFWDATNMRDLSLLIRDRQREGATVDFYAARLRELADPRITVLGWGTNDVNNAAAMVATEVNAVWNTNFDATTIRDGLANGLPTAP
jgi:hypothetical protein